MRTEQQFTTLYRESLPLISKYLFRRVEANQVEELCSQVFEIAWQKRTAAPAGFELPWLYRIAANVISNHRRSLARETSLIASLREPNSAPSAESIALADIELAEAWAKLKPAEQNVLALAAFEGLGVHEISLALGISGNAAAVRLHRARANLALLLEYQE